ncbi:hypothetical protein DMI70_15970 [Escherichia coli]|nr:hypothetical protein [Escherichia coli]
MDCVQSYSDYGDENRLGITEFALATTAGNSGDSPGFTSLDHRCINANGIAVGLVIRFSRGHADQIPPEPLIGAPVPPLCATGTYRSINFGLAGGVSWGRNIRS